MSDTTADTGTEDRKRSGRRPEGPEHAQRGGIGQPLKRTVTEFSEDELSDSAAALTYYMVLAVFPALLALVSIVGIVGDPHTVTKDLNQIVGQVAPQSVVKALQGPITGLTKSSGTAGILLVAGILGALWSASGYVGGFMRAANHIYEVEEGRSFLKLRPLQMLVTLILILLAVLVIVAVAATGPIASAVGSTIGVSKSAVTVWSIAKWPVMFVVVVFMFSVLYYSAPNAKLGGLRSIVPGAAIAIVVWLIASGAFAFYVANFGSYNKTYGTLGGITNLVILLGAEFNAERERSRQLDAGVPEAERELQLPERSAPKAKKRSRTA